MSHLQNNMSHLQNNINTILKKTFDLESEIEIVNFNKNPYNNIIKKKIIVTKYIVNNKDYYIDTNNNIYSLINPNIFNNIGSKIGYFKDNIIYIS